MDVRKLNTYERFVFTPLSSELRQVPGVGNRRCLFYEHGIDKTEHLLGYWFLYGRRDFEKFLNSVGFSNERIYTITSAISQKLCAI